MLSSLNPTTVQNFYLVLGRRRHRGGLFRIIEAAVIIQRLSLTVRNYTIDRDGSAIHISPNPFIAQSLLSNARNQFPLPLQPYPCNEEKLTRPSPRHRFRILPTRSPPVSQQHQRNGERAHADDDRPERRGMCNSGPAAELDRVVEEDGTVETVGLAGHFVLLCRG